MARAMESPDDEMDHEHDIKDASGMNVTERKLFEAMKDIGLSPEYQHMISKMKVDFAFPADAFAVEINGPYHQSEKQQLADKRRYFVMQKLGWQRKTFDAKRVYNDPIGIAYKIKFLLAKHGKVSTYSEEQLKQLKGDLNVEAAIKKLESKASSKRIRN